MTNTAMSYTSLRRRTVLLCAVLAAVLALLWLAPASVATWRRWRAPAPQPPALNEFERAALTPREVAGVQQPTLQRPLFSSTRRPPPKEAKAPPPAAAPVYGIAQAQLRGLVDAGDAGGALVELDDATHFVRVGDTLPGTEWRLVELEGRTARFESSARRHVLELPFLENLGASPAVPAPPAAAQRRRR